MKKLLRVIIICMIAITIPTNYVSAATVKSPETVEATATGKKTVEVSWEKVKGANGYEIYYMSTKSDDYVVTKAKTIQKKTETNIQIKKGTYFIFVRAYKKINDKKVYSSYKIAEETIKLPLKSNNKENMTDEEIVEAEENSNDTIYTEDYDYSTVEFWVNFYAKK